MDNKLQQRAQTVLQGLQKQLCDRSVAAILVRSTDKYFNEYVPLDRCLRAKITNFKGSAGDALITQNAAHLIVDGRYSLQAAAQAPDFTVHVVPNGQSIENYTLNLLATALKKGDRMAYDPATVDLRHFALLEKATGAVGATLEDCAPSFWPAIVPSKIAQEPKIWQAPLEFTGAAIEEKLQALAPDFAEGIDAFLAVKLDDIAWLTNLRGDYFVQQMTFPSLLCLTPHKVLLATTDAGKRFESSHLAVVPENEFFKHLPNFLSGTRPVMGIDPSQTSKAHQLALQAAGFSLKEVRNPLARHKAVKNDQELHHMRVAFKKADQVVFATAESIAQIYRENGQVTEAQVDDLVQDQFRQSGAIALSFRPICAGEKNGAYIHYSNPDHKNKVAAGSLFLLDTGGYYEGGYATDLTRTFLLGQKPAAAWQKEMFTLVLKASIAGLSARFRRGTVGEQLDAIVRAPLWRVGLDFAHGTGHGVGINVHEFPPRIAPGSTTVLEERHVFSIEPGLYFAGKGGVRIENLVTVVADPDKKEFLRILPLTFSPFDDRLIEHSMLDAFEESFLKYYEKEWSNNAAMPNLPPLPGSSFA
jgi:Xaa-Pro aminopeptidase